ncbi:MAG: hypothetical protein ACI9ND_003433 [Yoonia sp.]
MHRRVLKAMSLMVVPPSVNSTIPSTSSGVSPSVP